MEHHVIIKGNRYGIVLVMDPDIDFEDLLIEIGVRFDDSARFFNMNSQLAITFEGRHLSTEEIERVLALIRKRTTLRIPYVIDQNPAEEEQFLKVIEANGGFPDKEQSGEASPEETKVICGDRADGQFYHGTLRSGQSVESSGSIVVVGDVNPGATVQAGGSIMILGSLKGTAIAGTKGDDKAFVMALSMDPIQIQINTCIARSGDKQKGKKSKKEVPQIAYIDDGGIYIEEFSRNIAEELHV